MTYLSTGSNIYCTDPTTAAGARSNLGIVAGSMTATFTDGKYTGTFESFGLSQRPSYMIVKGNCAVAHDWYFDVYYDSGASTSNIVLYGTVNGGKAVNNTFAFTYIAIP